ncbi:hypothetical protein KY290_023098 [Solanum tuberosum]|uniref:Uncharacterized protein n=1 Tax=Solanum tuberosum TaxID=4113 RepID=A0ABQ7V688_SOLTU|nr:hypothetical protein KY284_022018 [Solanum tuberosum]KAH0684372.1 hypothetical protein KY289_022124 [Solanum tuberosum]KAH0694789.1 hypothetical protein KY285_021886 [Solanum tuberosum]KAH0759605.1 hypothetical protein KY290_023098 [Solanum tuberosum]
MGLVHIFELLDLVSGGSGDFWWRSIIGCCLEVRIGGLGDVSASDFAENGDCFGVVVSCRSLELTGDGGLRKWRKQSWFWAVWGRRMFK